MLYYKIFFSLFLVFFLSGCSYDYYIKDEGIVYKQRKLFKQLCEAEDRSVIYKTIEVEGYLTASNLKSSCMAEWDQIFTNGYQYAECLKGSVNGYHIPVNAGIYHFTVENNGHPGCGTGKQWLIKRFHEIYHGNNPAYKETNLWKHYREKYSAQLTGKCLVIQKVDRPKSQYMYLATLSYYDEHEKMYSDELKKKYPYESESKKGLISSSDDHYIAIQTGTILAKTSNFTFYPKGRVFSYSTSIDCKEKKRISPPEIFIPNNKQK